MRNVIKLQDGHASRRRSGLTGKRHTQGTKLSWQCGLHNLYAGPLAATVRIKSANTTRGGGAHVGMFLVLSPRAQGSVCLQQPTFNMMTHIPARHSPQSLAYRA